MHAFLHLDLTGEWPEVTEIRVVREPERTRLTIASGSGKDSIVIDLPAGVRIADPCGSVAAPAPLRAPASTSAPMQAPSQAPLRAPMPATLPPIRASDPVMIE